MQWLRLSRLYQIPVRELQQRMTAYDFAEQLAYDRILAEPEKPQITEDFARQQAAIRRERHISLNRR